MRDVEELVADLTRDGFAVVVAVLVVEVEVDVKSLTEDCG